MTTNDLEKARELAQRLGYAGLRTELDPNGRPIIHIGDVTTREEVARYEAAGFAVVNDDDRGRTPRIVTNPETGMSEYRSARTPSITGQLSVSTPTGGPPAILEKPPFFDSNTAIQVDRFALNPGEDFFRALLPGAEFVGAAPEMFATGPLPPLTGSGADPAILRWVPWYVRHSAALASSRAQLLMIIEETYDGSPDYQQVQSEEGQAHLQAYLSRISGWAHTSPEPPLGNEQIEEFVRSAYPSSAD
jgi:hypothetical protein